MPERHQGFSLQAGIYGTENIRRKLLAFCGYSTDFRLMRAKNGGI
jgi:hypothetical protein